MKKHIPNILTLANLISGCIAVTMVFQGYFGWVLFWVIVAAIFDLLDGTMARLLKAQSKLGKELDSLADVVSFGVAPGMALFVLMRDELLMVECLTSIANYIPYVAFLLPAFSAYRLAKFNIDDRQTTAFLGLPTPANGLFWASFCFGILPFIDGCYYTLFLAILFIGVMSFLMASEIPMFSFKVKKFGFRGNERQIGIVIGTIVLIFFFGMIGVAMGILAYILISIFTKKLN